MNFGMDYQGNTGGGATGGGSSFGGGGGNFGGGGGGNFGGGGGGNFGGSQPTTKPGRKSYDEQTLVPVTARMVLKTQESSEGTGSLVLADRRELYQVKLVGAVRTFEDNSTHVNFEIEDGTGLVQVKQWLDDNDCAAIHEMRAECLKENIYVKVFGQVKEYDGKKTIVAHCVRKLSSGNELTYHMLEVVYSAERHKRADTIVAPPPMMQSTGGIGFGAPQGGVPVASAAGGTGNELFEAVKSYFLVEGEKYEMGAPVRECIQNLGSRFSEQEVRKTIEGMASEGIIYSTINEDNYKIVPC